MAYARRGVRVAMIALGLSIGWLLLSATHTLAAYVPSEPPSFPTSPGPSGVAVDQSNGDIYISSTSNGIGTVEKIEPNGTLVKIFTVPGSGATTYQLAVDNSSGPSSGDLYVADYTESVVYKYDENGNLIGELKGFESGTAVAIDSKGNLYVGQYSAGSIIEFPPTATNFSEGKVVLAGLHEINALAFNSKDDLYVAENIAHKVTEIGGTLEFMAKSGGGFEPTPKEIDPGGLYGSLGVTVDLSTNTVFVDNYTFLQEYDESGAPVGGSFGSFEASNSVAVSEKTKAVYAAEGHGNAVDAFSPGQALKISKTGGGEGAVNSDKFSCLPSEAECSYSYPAGTKITLEEVSEASSEFIKWSSGPCAGSTAPTCEVTLSSETTVTAEFVLLPKFALTVSSTGNGHGAVASGGGEINCGATCKALIIIGSEVTLTAEAAVGSSFVGWSGGGCSGTSTCEITMTDAAAVTADFVQAPPSVITEYALGVSPTAATVTGKVDPNHAPAEQCQFEYGLTASYGSTASCTPSPEEGTATTSVSAQLSGLTPHQLYHYRVSMRGVGGLSQGRDRTFETSESASELAAEAAAKKHAEEAEKKKQEEEAAKKKHEEEVKKLEEERANQPVSVKIKKIKIGTNGLTLTLEASQNGTVTISGSGLKATTVSVNAGVNQAKVAFTATGRRIRKHRKKVKVTVALKAGGKTSSKSETIKL
jgi:hypothetical protein